jgi:hypothetical protein
MRLSCFLCERLTGSSSKSLRRGHSEEGEGKASSSKESEGVNKPTGMQACVLVCVRVHDSLGLVSDAKGLDQLVIPQPKCQLHENDT